MPLTAATLMRLELLTPQGDLVSSETYNKLFTMHGVVMLFFFLIPSIPAVLGNFVVPMMIGAKDLAFPRLNLASWYVYVVGSAFRASQLAPELICSSTYARQRRTGATCHNPRRRLSAQR